MKIDGLIIFGQNTGKKSMHKRDKWMEKRLRDVVDNRTRNILVYDFMEVINVICK